MNLTSLALMAGLATLASPLLADVDLSKLPPPAKQTGVTYTKDIRPIFEATCFRCHGDERQKAELRLDSREAVLKGSENGKVIVPGKSAESLLVIAVAQLDPEKAMPPKRGPGGGRGPGGPGGAKNFAGGNGPQPPAGGPGAPGGGNPGPGGRGGGPMSKPLTPEQVGLVRAWIDQGAK
jgi:hypothetical protein